MRPMTEFVKCNLCGEQTATIVYAHVARIDTSDTQVVQCNHCGLVYLNPRLKRLADNFTMDEGYLRQFYLPYYQKIGLLTATGMLEAENNHGFHLGYLTKLEGYRMTNRLLDVGCAIGLFLAAAKSDGWECFGVDPSGPLSAYGRQQLGVNVQHGELKAMAFPKHYFDVVTLWNVTEHLLDPTSVLQEIFRIVRPGGLVIVQVPNWNDIARDFLGTKWDMFVTDHFYYFTPATLRKLLTGVGFRIKQVDARELCDSEIQEITSKINAETAQQALAQLKAMQDQERGSTITAFVEKPVTTMDRFAKAAHLVRSGQISGLVREIYNYIQWKRINAK